VSSFFSDLSHFHSLSGLASIGFSAGFSVGFSIGFASAGLLFFLMVSTNSFIFFFNSAFSSANFLLAANTSFNCFCIFAFSSVRLLILEFRLAISFADAAAAAVAAAAAAASFHDDFFVEGVSTQTQSFLPNCSLETRYLSLLMKLAVCNLSYEKSDNGFLEKSLPKVDLQPFFKVFLAVFHVSTAHSAGVRTALPAHSMATHVAISGLKAIFQTL
jgi:hypothetical protein